MNEDIMQKAGFGKEIERVKAGKCPFCNQLVHLNDFRDTISIKEYKISGLCQHCQDDFFGKGE